MVDRVADVVKESQRISLFLTHLSTLDFYVKKKKKKIC